MQTAKINDHNWYVIYPNPEKGSMSIFNITAQNDSDIPVKFRVIMVDKDIASTPEYDNRNTIRHTVLQPFFMGQSATIGLRNVICRWNQVIKLIAEGGCIDIGFENITPDVSPEFKKALVFDSN